MADQTPNKKNPVSATNEPNNDATVLSSTELSQAEQTVLQDHAALQAAIGDSEATILSATEMEQLKTQALLDDDATKILDATPSLILDDATLALDSNQATVLAGGTQAVHHAINTNFSPNVNVGSVIKDRFTLEKLLGRGGMGEVYLATDKRKLEAQDKNPYVALKVLGENFKRHPQAFVALQREARKTQELAHPNIVTVYDFDRDKDMVFMTMEYLAGAPLDELLRSSPKGLPPEQANSILLDISNALTYAHSHQIIQ